MSGAGPSGTVDPAPACARGVHAPASDPRLPLRALILGVFLCTCWVLLSVVATAALADDSSTAASGDAAASAPAPSAAPPAAAAAQARQDAARPDHAGKPAIPAPDPGVALHSRPSVEDPAPDRSSEGDGSPVRAAERPGGSPGNASGRPAQHQPVPPAGSSGDAPDPDADVKDAPAPADEPPGRSRGDAPPGAARDEAPSGPPEDVPSPGTPGSAQHGPPAADGTGGAPSTDLVGPPPPDLVEPALAGAAVPARDAAAAPPATSSACDAGSAVGPRAPERSENQWTSGGRSVPPAEHAVPGITGEQPTGAPVAPMPTAPMPASPSPAASGNSAGGAAQPGGGAGPPATLPGVREPDPLSNGSLHLHPRRAGDLIDAADDPGSSPD